MALCAEVSGVLHLQAWHQPTVRGDHPPPGQSLALGEGASHRSSRPRAPGFCRHLGVGEHIARLGRRDHLGDTTCEGCHVRGGAAVVSRGTVTERSGSSPLAAAGASTRFGYGIRGW